MNRRHLSVLFTGATILGLLLVLIHTSPVQADDRTPPSEDPQSVEVTPDPSVGTEADSADAALLVDPAVSDKPFLVQIPAGTDVVVLDTDGQVEPLATQDAVDALAAVDPMWCPAGALPNDPDCTTSMTITELLSSMQSNPGSYSQNGVIYFDNTAPVTSSFVLDDSPSSLATAYNTLKVYNLILQGGWNGEDAGTFGGPTNFDGANAFLRVGTKDNPWAGSVTINDIAIQNVTSSTDPSLEVDTSGTVAMNDVSVTGSGEGQNAIDIAASNVDLTNVSASNSSENGISITASEAGTVTLNNVTAQDNAGSGVLINGADTLVNVVGGLFTNNARYGIEATDSESTNMPLGNIWTDLPDYAPGSVVTISGNSNSLNDTNLSFLPGETVHVDVQGPNGYTAVCEAVANEFGGWSCQITLWASDLAIGDYSYTAKGITSGFTDTGTFKDGIVRTVTVGAQTGTITYPTGGSVNYTVTITTSGNGTNTFTTTVTGLPSYATWSISPSPLSMTVKSTTLTLTTNQGGTTPAGKYTFTVAVGGVSKNGTLVVLKGNTTTTITNAAALGTATVVGQSYTVTFSVTTPGGGTPSGNVTVRDGTVTCTATVEVGNCNLTSTTAGAKTITAVYAGDTNFNNSTSTGVAHTVSKANTTTTITNVDALVTATVVGQSYAVNFSVVAVAPGSGTPTGNVTVRDGTVTCTATAATGTCNLKSTTAGAKTITATYAGDTKFNTSVSMGVAHTVNKANTTTTITNAAALGTATVVGQSYAVNFSVVAVAPGSGTPAGNVTVSDGVATCTATAATGTCNLKSTTAGAKTITATYVGNANFNTSTSAGVAHTVNKANTTTTITNAAALGTATVVGQSYAVNFSVVAVAPGSGTPAGNVTVSDGMASCTATLPAATCNLISTTMGVKTITASFSGNGDFNTSTSAGVAHMVNKGNQTITITTHALANAAYGVDFAVTATASSGLPVSYSSGSPSVCTNSGATFTMISSSGTCVVQYNQAGDSNYNAASQVTENTTAQKVNQTITVTTHAPANAAYGTNFTVAATGGGSGNPIVYSAAGGCSNVGVNFTMTSSTVACIVQYDQAGNENYNAAPQLTDSVTAQEADQAVLTVIVTPSTIVYGNTAALSTTGGSGTGAVTYSVGVSTGCSVAVSTLSITDASGTCSVTATKTADSNYNAESSAPASVTLQKANATCTITGYTGVYHGAAHGASGACMGVGGVNLSASLNLGSSFTDVPGGTAHWTFTGGTNHNDQSGDVDISINKANQIITFGALSEKTYGDPDFSVSATASSSLTVSFTAAGDCSVLGNTIHITETGSCTVTAHQDGDTNTNAAPDIDRSFNISQASSSVTVTCPASETYTGAAIEPCTASYATGDGLSGSLTATYTDNTNVSTAIASATYAGDSNHEGSSNLAAFEISQTSSTVTVTCMAGTPYIYTGLAQSPCTVEATGVGMSPVDVTASLIYNNNTNAGVATADAGWAGDINHTGDTGSGSFTINAKTASVTPNNDFKTYGAADPALTGSLSSFIAGDSITATYSRVAGETVAGSPYTISAVLGPIGILGNYDITYNTADFTITPKTITVTADSKSKLVGSADPLLTFTFFPALVAGDSFSGSLTRIAGEAVGIYAIQKGTLALSSNYTLTYIGANLMITPLPAATAAAPTMAGPPIAPLIPITDGHQVAKLDCGLPTNILQMEEFQMNFINLCGYSVELDEVLENGLPNKLSTDSTFVAGVSVNILKDGKKGKTLPAGAMIKVSYDIPADMVGENFAVLYWDQTLNSGTGGWFELPAFATNPDGTLVVTPLHPVHPEDGMKILSGVQVTSDGKQVEFSVNFSGTFVLVIK